MNRRKFLSIFGVATVAPALAPAIPFGRVWSFPSKIVIPQRTGNIFSPAAHFYTSVDIESFRINFPWIEYQNEIRTALTSQVSVAWAKKLDREIVSGVKRARPL